MAGQENSAGSPKWWRHMWPSILALCIRSSNSAILQTGVRQWD
jgi:hypothetical protein